LKAYGSRLDEFIGRLEAHEYEDVRELLEEGRARRRNLLQRSRNLSEEG
jgi:hypothetical protein